MKDSLQLVKDLLSGRNWDAAILATDHLLADGELTSEQKGYCYYAKCRALSNLDRYSAALEPGLRAVAIVGEAGPCDTLCNTLLELAWVQYYLKLYEESAATLHSYLDHVSTCMEHDGDKTTDAFISLGTNYRALGDHPKALNFFFQAWQRAQGGEATRAERARSQSAWEALQLGRLDLAEQLLPAGDAFLVDHPDEHLYRASHYIDRVQFSLLRNNHSDAFSWCLKAIPHAIKYPELVARLFTLLYTVAKESGRPDDALVSLLFALQEARRADRHDIATEVRDLVTHLRLEHPDEVVAKFVETLRTTGTDDREEWRR